MKKTAQKQSIGLIICMALVKYGEMISGMSGSINGTTHSHNRGGAYMRNRSVPSNPQTSFQSAARAVLTAFSTAWRGLTQAQRDAWNGAVSNFARTNTLGDLRNPTGKNLYTALNTNLSLVGVGPISDPPNVTGTFQFTPTTVTADASAGTVDVAWSSGAIPAGMAVLVEATAGQSAGKNFFKNLFRFIVYLDAGDVTPSNVGAAYTARFGAMSAGQKIALRFTPINKVTGERGTGQVVTTIIVP